MHDAAPVLKPEEDQPKVCAFLHKAIERAKVPGISVAMSVGGLSMEASAGIINLQTAQEMTTGACFELACLNKWLTAMLVMDAVGEAGMPLDEKVTGYLPELEGDNLTQISIRQLLNHTAGYKEIDISDADIQQDYSYEVFMEQLNQGEMTSEPGQLFNYSHTGYVMLRVMLERVTGKSIQELLDEKIFRPLNIDRSASATKLENEVQGHRLDHDSGVLEFPLSVDWCDFWEGSLSGRWLTMKDLVAIGAGIISGRILSMQTREWMFNKSQAKRAIPGINLGSLYFKDGTWGAASISAGQCSAIRLDPERKTVIAVGINSENIGLRDICIKMLFEALS